MSEINGGGAEIPHEDIEELDEESIRRQYQHEVLRDAPEMVGHRVESVHVKKETIEIHLDNGLVFFYFGYIGYAKEGEKAPW